MPRWSNRALSWGPSDFLEYISWRCVFHDLLAPWYNYSYTTAVKTAISIPDEIFEQAERLAKTRGWSRSELYANAVSAFVNSERFSGVREKLDAVYGNGVDDSSLEPLLANAQARSIAKENW